MLCCRSMVKPDTYKKEGKKINLSAQRSKNCFPFSYINNAIDYGQYLWIIHIFYSKPITVKLINSSSLTFPNFFVWIQVFFFDCELSVHIHSIGTLLFLAIWWCRRWNGVYLHIKNYDKKTEVILPLYGLKRNKPQRKRKEIILKVFSLLYFRMGERVF